MLSWLGRLITRLASESATLTSLVGTRIGPWPLPQDTALPCVTWRVTSIQDADAGGVAVEITVVFDAWASAYSAACEIADAVVSAMSASQPTEGSWKWCGCVVAGGESTDDMIQGADPGVFCERRTIRCWAQKVQ